VVPKRLLVVISYEARDSAGDTAPEPTGSADDPGMLSTNANGNIEAQLTRNPHFAH
jgi:hypothetical protein